MAPEELKKQLEGKGSQMKDFLEELVRQIKGKRTTVKDLLPREDSKFTKFKANPVPVTDANIELLCKLLNNFKYKIVFEDSNNLIPFRLEELAETDVQRTWYLYHFWGKDDMVLSVVMGIGDNIVETHWWSRSNQAIREVIKGSIDKKVNDDFCVIRLAKANYESTLYVHTQKHDLGTQELVVGIFAGLRLYNDAVIGGAFALERKGSFEEALDFVKGGLDVHENIKIALRNKRAVFEPQLITNHIDLGKAIAEQGMLFKHKGSYSLEFGSSTHAADLPNHLLIERDGTAKLMMDNDIIYRGGARLLAKGSLHLLFDHSAHQTPLETAQSFVLKLSADPRKTVWQGKALWHDSDEQLQVLEVKLLKQE